MTWQTKEKGEKRDGSKRGKWSGKKEKEGEQEKGGKEKEEKEEEREREEKALLVFEKSNVVYKYVLLMLLDIYLF